MPPYEIANIILSNSESSPNIRLLLAGPCDVGKTEVAKSLVATNLEIKHIEQDKLKLKEKPSPCSIRYLNIEQCFLQEIANVSQYIIDTAGNNIFRKSVNNQARLQQLSLFKKEHQIEFVLLTASYKNLKERFYSSKYSVDDFEDIWNSWEIVEKPFWEKCADLIINVETGTFAKVS